MCRGLSITLQPAHDKSPVLRVVSQFHIMYCYYFNIKGKEKGELGNRTYCLAGNVGFFWLPPFPLHLSQDSTSFPIHSPQHSPELQTDYLGLPSRPCLAG